MGGGAAAVDCRGSGADEVGAAAVEGGVGGGELVGVAAGGGARESRVGVLSSAEDRGVGAGDLVVVASDDPAVAGVGVAESAEDEVVRPGLCSGGFVVADDQVP
jgi:hypothetical protein